MTIEISADLLEEIAQGKANASTYRLILAELKRKYHLDGAPGNNLADMLNEMWLELDDAKRHLRISRARINDVESWTNETATQQARLDFYNKQRTAEERQIHYRSAYTELLEVSKKIDVHNPENPEVQRTLTSIIKRVADWFSATDTVNTTATPQSGDNYKRAQLTEASRYVEFYEEKERQAYNRLKGFITEMVELLGALSGYCEENRSTGTASRDLKESEVEAAKALHKIHSWLVDHQFDA